jgi:hypothetical protein
MTNRRPDQHYRGSDLGNGDNGDPRRSYAGEHAVAIGVFGRVAKPPSADRSPA